MVQALCFLHLCILSSSTGASVSQGSCSQALRHIKGRFRCGATCSVGLGATGVATKGAGRCTMVWTGGGRGARGVLDMS